MRRYAGREPHRESADDLSLDQSSQLLHGFEELLAVERYTLSLGPIDLAQEFVKDKGKWEYPRISHDNLFCTQRLLFIHL
jgi:hypothetical protein